jgi:uncharacterized protein (TIGR03435 family)
MRLLSLPIALLLLSPYVAAQVPTPPPRPTFEVASIKRNTSGDPAASVRVQPGGRLVITNNSVFNMIRNAYNTQRFEMIPGPNVPSWIDTDRWDIAAKAPEDATGPQLMVMLQNLLVDRFKLVARRETREMPVYALVIARTDGQLGPQLHRSTVDCNAAAAAARAGGLPPQPGGAGPFCGTRTNGGTVQMSGVPLANFVRNLGAVTGRFVIDKTGLTGPFDLQLTWTPDQAIGGGGALTDGTSLVTAIQEQLGLKLEAQRAAVEVLVIESAERPQEN